MNKHKWTPGEWRIESDGWISTESDPVCMIEEGGFSGHFKYAEHDAHLIAAAPDLYEALAEIDAWSRRQDIALPSPAIYRAMAKARGEAS